MTAEEQLKQIAETLGYPADQKDVVFLVERTVGRVKDSLLAKDKQIAKLEAELDQMRNQFHDLTNEKLKVEAKLNQKLAEPKEETEVQVQNEPEIHITPTEEEEVPS